MTASSNGASSPPSFHHSFFLTLKINTLHFLTLNTLFVYMLLPYPSIECEIHESSSLISFFITDPPAIRYLPRT